MRRLALRAAHWSSEELMATHDLGLCAHGEFKPIAQELAGLRRASEALARIYQDRVNGCLDKEEKRVSSGFSAKLGIRVAVAEGRRAVYDNLGVRLLPLSKGLAESMGMDDLYKCGSLLDLIVHGNALQYARVRAGMPTPETTISKVWGSTGSFRIALEQTGHKRSYFVKEGSMGPDIFAVKLLRSTGIVVPEISAIEYDLPFRGDSEFGIMDDIAEMEGVVRAVSLRALARDEFMEEFVWRNFEDFCEKLGHAFEVSRKLGLQDRHARNMGVAMMESGELAIYMIDLDVVACYPDIGLFQHSYAGQVNSIVQSLDFSNAHGELVRSSPEAIRSLVGTEDKKLLTKRQKRIYAQMNRMFKAGTEKAHRFYRMPATREELERAFREHDGHPVGWKQTPGMLNEDRKTGHAINGSRQELIGGGPDCGRFRLRWRDAFSKFFENMSTVPEIFWTRALKLAPQKEAATIVY
jgi:hypothetical protein